MSVRTVPAPTRSTPSAVRVEITAYGVRHGHRDFDADDVVDASRERWSVRSRTPGFGHGDDPVADRGASFGKTRWS